MNPLEMIKYGGNDRSQEFVYMVDISQLNQSVHEVQKPIESHQRVVEAIHKLSETPAMKSLKPLEESSAVKSLCRDIERHKALMGVMQGPLGDLRRIGGFELYEQLRPAQEVIDTFDSRFALPKTSEAIKLIQEFQQASAAGILAKYTAQSDIRRAMEAMRSPWLDAQEPLRSVTGFAGIQGIGRMLDCVPSFHDQVSATLRNHLGDWREQITWPESVLTDFSAREAFYLDLGFDPNLTTFPATAFQESTEVAGLSRERPPLVSVYDEPVPPSEDSENEEALNRTNLAHDWLLRLETNLRSFVDTRMSAIFGSDWPKHQLPNDVYDKWLQKYAKAVDAGRPPKPLISYADFTDYEQVICKKDNWRQVFSDYFVRKESVRESFQRLYPIRVDTMHARPIMQDDELLLYVEVKRLIRVIMD